MCVAFSCQPSTIQRRDPPIFIGLVWRPHQKHTILFGFRIIDFGEFRHSKHDFALALSIDTSRALIKLYQIEAFGFLMCVVKMRWPSVSVFVCVCVWVVNVLFNIKIGISKYSLFCARSNTSLHVVVYGSNYNICAVVNAFVLARFG